MCCLLLPLRAAYCRHQPPKADSALPAGTTSSPSPTAMPTRTSAFCSSGPTMTDPATPVHICLPVVADTAYTLPVLLPTNTAPPATIGAVTSVPLPNDHRSGLPEAATATSCPLSSVYMLLPSKAGAVRDAKVPVDAPVDFDRITGVSLAAPRA